MSTSFIKMYKIIFIITSIITTSCAQVIDMKQDYDNGIQANCVNMFLLIRGNIDFVYGATSTILFECPVFLHGETIQWNKEERIVEKENPNPEPDIGTKFGREYGSVFD